MSSTQLAVTSYAPLSLGFCAGAATLSSLLVGAGSGPKGHFNTGPALLAGAGMLASGVAYDAILRNTGNEIAADVPSVALGATTFAGVQAMAGPHDPKSLIKAALFGAVLSGGIVAAQQQLSRS